MNKDLDTSKRTKGILHLRTKNPDGTTFNGVILDNKKTLVIIQEFVGFEADGIIVIPKRWIRGIRNGKHEQCATKIIHSAKNLGAADDSGWYIDLTKMEEIITYLKTADIWPAVEVLYKNDPSLYMGFITDVSKSSFRIYCYDAAGEWEKEYELEYSEVFKIEINSRYVRHFNEYMRTKKKASAS